MWVTGSYAEPLQSDENPESWSAFLMDPHTDRLSANRQRQMNYDYAQSKLCQYSAMPGFMSHQTERQGCASLSEQWNVRDFDFYGITYGIVSAIGTGGLNAVVCNIPARDPDEFDAFPLSGLIVLVFCESLTHARATTVSCRPSSVCLCAILQHMVFVGCCKPRVFAPHPVFAVTTWAWCHRWHDRDAERHKWLCVSVQPERAGDGNTTRSACIRLAHGCAVQ